MKHKPHKLTCFLLLPLLAAMGTRTVILAATSSGQTADEAAKPAAADEATATTSPADPAASPAPEPAPSTPAGDAAASPSGAELLQKTREKLQDLSSLKCDIHQTSYFAGMKFAAVGHYVQASGNRFRLEYQIFPMTSVKASDAAAGQIDAELPGNAPDNKGSLTQVSDGNILYTYWANGPLRRVTRRNITDILNAAENAAAFSRSRAVQDLGLGGLGALIARIENLMDLAPVRTETVGELELQVVTGRWNSEIRQKMFQLPPDAQVIPQEFIPEYVRIYIDAATSLPRRIQYLKRFPDPAQKQIRPIVTIDFRQIVLNDSVDDSTFVFRAPEGVKEEDITEGTIQSMRRDNQQPSAGAGNAAAADAAGRSSPAPVPGNVP